MKTIIAGSRTLTSHDLNTCFKQYKLPITEIVCGCAPDIDIAGYYLAREKNIPVAFFPAWPHHHTWAFFKKKPGEQIHYPRGGYEAGKGNGFRRNTAMSYYGEALFAIWDGKSNGTTHSIKECESRGLVVTVFELQSGNTFKRRM